MSSDLISRKALKKAIEQYQIQWNKNCDIDIAKWNCCGTILAIIDNAPSVELANHLRDRIQHIDHEITIPQSYNAYCFLDGKRKAFQYVLDLLKGGAE